MSVTSFMYDYRRQTELNPLQPWERVYRGIAALTIADHPQGCVVQLDSIRSFNRGQGCGSAALRWLCTLAATHGVAIAGMALPCGNKRPRLSVSQLHAWYRRHGFTVRRNGQMYFVRGCVTKGSSI